MGNEKIVLISNEKNWIEQIAKDQLVGVSQLKDVIRVVGLPDLHAGKSPIGIALLSQNRFYPHLIGNDIGCGMGLFETAVKLKKYKQDKWVTRLSNIRQLSDLWIMNPYEEESPILELGTIGNGNHFAEFQCIHEVVNKDLYEQLGLEKDKVFLLVHSGSRGYGEKILRAHLKPEGILKNSDEAVTYLEEHEKALIWARRNRELVAKKLLGHLGVSDEIVTVIDCYHNFLEETSEGFIHRKGTTSSKVGPIVIPGSRGSLSYICMPKEDTSLSLDSLSHGAGRKWARSLCKSRINNKYDRDSIRCTELKSKVVCHDTNLLFQEAPEAYKNIEQVIDSLMKFGLIEVVATLRPLITYKG